MPRRDAKGLLLSDAERLGHIMQVTCNLCRAHRYYRPEDLRHLLGNAEIDSLRRRIRCEGCDHREYVEVQGVHLTAGERQGLRVRRLKGIRLIRRPIWEDEPL